MNEKETDDLLDGARGIAITLGFTAALAPAVYAVILRSRIKAMLEGKMDVTPIKLDQARALYSFLLVVFGMLAFLLAPEMFSKSDKLFRALGLWLGSNLTLLGLAVVSAPAWARLLVSKDEIEKGEIRAG
jgi:uncharacterized membrane protein YbhN (UPF0104 family)